MRVNSSPSIPSPYGIKNNAGPGRVNEIIHLQFGLLIYHKLQQTFVQAEARRDGGDYWVGDWDWWGDSSCEYWGAAAFMCD